jgi:hypothetical protein
VISIIDGNGGQLVTSARTAVAGAIECELPAGHADWKIVVRAAQLAFAPSPKRVAVFRRSRDACSSIVLALASALSCRVRCVRSRTAVEFSGRRWNAQRIEREDEIGQLRSPFDRMADLAEPIA